jgi:TolB-like protein/DNA-binding winged helix-turn-helix (wHTH) protein/Flp pilus assembly protein TadD
MAAMQIKTQTRFLFGQFEFDCESRELRKSGQVIKLQAQPAMVLALLVNRAGECVTRHEIQQHVWGDNFVEFDQGLNYCISQIRGALGDKSETPVFIETIPRQGYRFIAPVTRRVEPHAPEGPQPATGVQLPGWRSRPRYLVGGLMLMAIVMIGLVVFLRSSSNRQPPTQVRLVVLPFDNLSADPEQEYFSDGLTEELITTLSQLNPKQLGVIARTSAMKYKGEKRAVDQIGRELGVEYILEGSVRSDGDRARMSVQLVRVSDQSHVWAQSYDRPLSDILEAQREVAQAVAEKLSLAILSGNQSPNKRGTTNPKVHEAYLKARYLLGKRSPDAIDTAITLLQRAITVDPSYAPAHACLAQAYLNQTGRLAAKVSKAKQSLQTAERLDESLPQTQLLLGYIALFGEWNWNAAKKHLELAIELDQGRAYSYHAYAAYLSTLGRHEEAIAQLKKAKELDPVSPAVLGDIGWIYYAAGNYDEAIKQSGEILELEPGEAFAHECMLYSYLRQGNATEALSHARQIMKLRGASNHELESISRNDAGESLHEYWKWSLAWLGKNGDGDRDDVDSCSYALFYADLGQREKAFDYLERAYRQRSELLVYLAIEPRYELLRSDPRFTELVRRIIRQ